MWKKSVILLAFLSVCLCSDEDFNSDDFEGYDGRRHKRPNIVFIMGDDLGWNDVGFRNPAMITPHIDDLALNGIILNQSYVQNLCSPSRSALMTGYYPFRTGFQTLVTPLYTTMALPLQFELLPQKLKKLRYATHMVGKWHLGSCNPAYLPINRGFDTHFGIMNAGQYYDTHTTPFIGGATPVTTAGVPNILDFFDGEEPALNWTGIYSSIPFVEQVEKAAKNTDKDKPFFLYYASQLPHCPLQAPQDKIDLYSNVANVARRNYSGMVSQFDSDIGSIIKTLKRNKLYKNSVIIFVADNGGEIGAGGCNYPLKGSKHTLWEGGHRATSFVHSPLLKRKGYTYNGLIHITDWYTTIVALAGGRSNISLDGFNVWPAITKNKPSPRTEFVYHLENHGNNITWAFRQGDYKLIKDMAGLPNYTVLPNDVTGKYYNTPGGNIYFQDIPNYPSYRLFNIKEDPLEDKNLYDSDDTHKAIADRMKARIESHYKNQMVYPLFVYTQLSQYQTANNLSMSTPLAPLGTNWCTTNQSAVLIDWSTNVPVIPLPQPPPA